MRFLVSLLALAAAASLSLTATAADPAAGQAKFQQLCATCHGPAGQGDGPASASLNPQPRDLSLAEWQASVDDAHIRTVIEEGGAAAGLSPMMTGFGHALGEEDLDNLVAYIRSLDD